MSTEQELYGDWIKSFRGAWSEAGPEGLESLCGPFLVDPTNEFRRSKKRVLFVGQETNGWYSISDFLDPTKGLSEALLWYREFDFAEAHPASRSPFWRFHRKLARGLGCHWRAVMWTNLVRFDGKRLPAGCASIVGQPYEGALLVMQRGLLTAEIERLGVEAVIFLTGPDYDHVIRNEFPSVAFVPAQGWQDRQFATLAIEGLPGVQMIRTYHPAYLQRASLFEKAADEVIRFCGGS